LTAINTRLYILRIPGAHSTNSAGERVNSPTDRRHCHRIINESTRIQVSPARAGYGKLPYLNNHHVKHSCRALMAIAARTH
jgi:hypothetical protein